MRPAQKCFQELKSFWLWPTQTGHAGFPGSESTLRFTGDRAHIRRITPSPNVSAKTNERLEGKMRISTFKTLPKASERQEAKVIENHKKASLQKGFFLVGQSHFGRRIGHVSRFRTMCFYEPHFSFAAAALMIVAFLM